MEPLLLSEKETLELLAMSRTSVRREMAKGRLKPLKVGRSLRFLSTDLTDFVERLRAEQYVENQS